MTGVGRVVALILAMLFAGTGVARADNEVYLSTEDYKKLDPFEAQRLGDADKVFDKKEWRQAKASYDAFMLEFPRSVAVPYALLRKGRSIQYDNKMKEAIDVYNDIMDYFPNAIPYAAPALFYLGESQWSNGNHKDALKTWKEMAEDVDYRQDRLAAYALNALADRLYADGEYADAAKFYLQAATDFRDRNRDAAGLAIRRLLDIWIRDRPNVKALRDACKQLKGFDKGPRGDYAENDVYFWTVIRENVRQHGEFPDAQRDQRIDYYKYWTDAMEGQQPKDDDFQKDLADFHFYEDGKRNKWIERLDAQFNAYQKDGDYDRVAKWMGWYREHMPKLEEYFIKLDFAKMRNEAIIQLLKDLFDGASRPMAKRIYLKLQFEKMSDRDKVNLARDFWGRDEEIVLNLCHRIQNADLAAMEELRYWHYWVGRGGGTKAAERGLSLADKCVLVAEYVKESYWMKGDLLRGIGKVEEAIAAYQATDDPPRSLFTIASCLVQLGRIEPAVGQLREIENFFPDEAPNAALKVAHVYRAAGKRDSHIGGLTWVLNKYPGSRESSAAHNELEDMGLSHLIRAGEDAK